jgi:hypothetical protein
MKHIKTFNESILGDVRRSTNSAMSSKYCHNCGERLESSSAFCSECGENQNDGEESNDFEIKGRLEKTGSSMSKTPSYVLRSMNKTIDGTSVLSGKINTWELSKWEGKEVTISGSTENGQSPKFNNPIHINSIS